MDGRHAGDGENAAGSGAAHDERTRLLESAFASSSDAIILTDARHRDNPIVAVNPAFERITGYPPEEVVGRNCRFLQGADRAQSELARLREAIARGEPVMVVLRNYRKDGELFWNELRVAPVRDAAGTITHYVGAQNDITERVRAEQALVRRNAELEAARDDLQEQAADLAEAQHARDRFMATVSHEMRTPINAVMGYLDLLDMGVAGDLAESQREYVHRGRRSSRQLLDLVNDVLDLTRADYGHLEVEVEPVDAVPVVEEAVALLEEQAARKGLAVAVEYAPGTDPARGLMVSADRRRLRQVLVNLLANAVKFTDRGGATLRVEAAGSAVRFALTDTGIGIAPDKLPFIFDEFFQADSNLTRRHGGSGLGLSISRRLARLMGGDLTAVSEPGRGSTFTLRVAAATSAGAPAATPDGPARGAAAGEASAAAIGAADAAADAAAPVAATVVVFGPSEGTVASLGRALYPDLRLVRVARADEVLPTVSEAKPSLVVLDVIAADGAGWQVAHALREDHRFDNVPLLILPATTDRAVRGTATALDLGAVVSPRRSPETPATPRPPPARRVRVAPTCPPRRRLTATPATASASSARWSGRRAPAARPGAPHGRTPTCSWWTTTPTPAASPPASSARWGPTCARRWTARPRWTRCGGGARTWP
jgi:PAS domain S-box-containing protein